MHRRALAVLATVLLFVLLPGSAAAAPVTSISLRVAEPSVAYGTTVVASGAMVPAALGVPVTLERKTGEVWTAIKTVDTVAYGRYAINVRMTGSAALRVRVSHEGNERVSAADHVSVTPSVVITSVGAALPFVGAQVTARVFPASYTARVSLTVTQSGRRLATATAFASDGRLTTLVPTPGVGTFRVQAQMPRRFEIHGSTVTFAVRARSSNLRVGSRGAQVRALHLRLRSLGYLVRDVRSTYTSASADAVMALRKVHRMPRAGTVNDAVWSTLGRTSRPRPRFASPSTHIEVDKRRQVLMVVQGGRVTGVLHVSTGATGNTPVGRFSIYQMGGSYLYRFMAFRGNFGIHGYPSVPSYPASHGCVREPMWAAAWVYNRSYSGETVYVYT